MSRNSEPKKPGRRVTEIPHPRVRRLVANILATTELLQVSKMNKHFLGPAANTGLPATRGNQAPQTWPPMYCSSRVHLMQPYLTTTPLLIHKGFDQQLPVNSSHAIILDSAERFQVHFIIE